MRRGLLVHLVLLVDLSEAVGGPWENMRLDQMDFAADPARCMLQGKLILPLNMFLKSPTPHLKEELG